ncbi:unnamed protein product, partial [Phaeothamnion confervicola]
DAEDWLRRDLGPGKILAALARRRFALDTGTFRYEVAPFVEVKQHHTLIGRWRGFGGSTNHLLWEFDDGQHCPGAGRREARVKLVCGTEHRLVSAEEPAKCRYGLILETPIACCDADVVEAEMAMA